MQTKQAQALSLISQFAPKDFGIRKGLYQIQDNEIKVYFFVNQNSSPSVITYLNSLASVVEQEVEGVQIISSVYFAQPGRVLTLGTKEEKYENLKLTKLSTAGVR